MTNRIVTLQDQNLTIVISKQGATPVATNGGEVDADQMLACECAWLETPKEPKVSYETRFKLAYMQELRTLDKKAKAFAEGWKSVFNEIYGSTHMHGDPASYAAGQRSLFGTREEFEAHAKAEVEEEFESFKQNYAGGWFSALREDGATNDEIFGSHEELKAEAEEELIYDHQKASLAAENKSKLAEWVEFFDDLRGSTVGPAYEDDDSVYVVFVDKRGQTVQVSFGEPTHKE